MEEILLPARYGLTHKLKHVGGNLWIIELDKNSAGSYRILGFEGEEKIGSSVYALDPEGGPFLAVGDKVNDYVIKSISTNGIFELIKDNKNEKS